MSLLAVQAALETKLKSVDPTFPTAWSNTVFTPTVGQAHQLPTLLPAEPDNSVAGASPPYQDRGLFQITLNFPQGNGSKDALTRAMLIRNSFPVGLSLVSGGITTVIETTPEIGSGLNEGPWYQIPVRVRWYANIQS